MNLKYSDKDSEREFHDALEGSPVVRNWLINRLLAYSYDDRQATLEIGVDPWTKTEKTSFSWAIYTQPMDDYGVIAGAQLTGVINGGLIYRGDDNYSSHT